MQRIQCKSEASKGVYCLQYDDQKIVSGLRDNTIKVNYIVLCRVRMNYQLAIQYLILLASASYQYRKRYHPIVLTRSNCGGSSWLYQRSRYCTFMQLHFSLVKFL